MRVALLPACLSLALGGCGQIEGTGDNNMAPLTEQPAVATLVEAELADLMAEGEVVLIDVRTPEEFAEGRIPGALNAPVETFDAAGIPLEEDRETILYCHSGNRSARAAEMLSQETGGTVRHLEGGIVAWEEAGREIIVSPDS